MEHPRPSFLRVGEVARLLGVPARRVEGWIERGWINVEGVGGGPGRPRRIPYTEVEVVKYAVAQIRRLDVKASDGLFNVARERIHGPE